MEIEETAPRQKRMMRGAYEFACVSRGQTNERMPQMLHRDDAIHYANSEEYSVECTRCCALHNWSARATNGMCSSILFCVKLKSPCASVYDYVCCFNVLAVPGTCARANQTSNHCLRPLCDVDRIYVEQLLSLTSVDTPACWPDKMAVVDDAGTPDREARAVLDCCTDVDRIGLDPRRCQGRGTAGRPVRSCAMRRRSLLPESCRHLSAMEVERQREIREIRE